MPVLVADEPLSLDLGDGAVLETFDVDSSGQRLAAVLRTRDKQRRLLVTRIGRPGRVSALEGTRPGPGECLTVSPDGGRVAVSFGDGGGFGVFDMGTGASIARAQSFDRLDVVGLDWHPTDGGLAVASGQYVEHFQFVSGTLTRAAFPAGLSKVARSQGEWIRAVAYHRDGSHLAASTNAPAVYVLDVGRASVPLQPSPAGTSNVVWSDDGVMLAAQAAGHGGTVVVWRNATHAVGEPFGTGAEHLHTFGPAEDFAPCAWEPKAQRLAIGDNSGHLGIYDVNGVQLEQLAADAKAPVHQVVWRDGRLFAWARWPRNRLMRWRSASEPAGGAEPSPKGNATVVVTATGPRAADVPGLWRAILDGPDDRQRHHATAPFTADRSATFAGIPNGTFWVRVDTKADVPWGPSPRSVEVECRNGRTERVKVIFG